MCCKNTKFISFGLFQLKLIQKQKCTLTHTHGKISIKWIIVLFCFPFVSEAVKSWIRSCAFLSHAHTKSTQCAALNMATRQTASWQSGSYPALVPHPVLLFLEEGWTGDPPPRLVLLLLCQSQLQIIIHLCLQATELGNFSSLSSTSVTFSKPFCSLRPSSSLSGSPVRTKHTHSGQSTNSSSCLHLQFIFPLTRQRKCLPPR